MWLLFFPNGTTEEYSMICYLMQVINAPGDRSGTLFPFTVIIESLGISLSLFSWEGSVRIDTHCFLLSAAVFGSLLR